MRSRASIHLSPVTFHILQKSAPGVTRTPDRRIRNPLLYPAELRAQWVEYLAANGRKSSESLKSPVPAWVERGEVAARGDQQLVLSHESEFGTVNE
jgi:hypothetical protein